MSKLDEVIAGMNKKCKEEVVTEGLSEYNYKRIPFTSPRMNYITFGGLPAGKVIEFLGEEHGGKTTTALDIVANYQHSGDGRKVLYVDAENSLDSAWAIKLGVNIEDMIIFQPKSQSAEQIFDFICDTVDTGEVGLWVLDSIGALLSQQELDKNIEEATYGGIAKPLTKFGKKIEMLNARHKCTGISINQMREVIGSMFPMQTTPGGKAWKHFCMVRLQFAKGKYLDESGKELTKSAESPAGNIVMVNMLKNKSCPPTRRVGQYRINYEYGVDYLADLVDVAIKFDVVRQSGAWFSIVDLETGEILEDKIHGLTNVYDTLETNKELLQKVEEQVDSKISI